MYKGSGIAGVSFRRKLPLMPTLSDHETRAHLEGCGLAETGLLLMYYDMVVDIHLGMPLGCLAYFLHCSEKNIGPTLVLASVRRANRSYFSLLRSSDVFAGRRIATSWYSKEQMPTFGLSVFDDIILGQLSFFTFGQSILVLNE